MFLAQKGNNIFYLCPIFSLLLSIAMQVTPYKEDQKSKKEQVADMFNNISRRYDLLNHLLSFGIDIYWRKQAVKLLKKETPSIILDVATGTGDFAIEALACNPEKIIGVDIAQSMLDIGKEKINKRGLQDKIELKYGDSEKLPFLENNFDAVIVSYGVRNFEDLEKGLGEMFRVLKPDGIVVIVEFSKPSGFPFKQLYNFYFHYILPVVGRMVSKDRAAYKYLPESVNAFPDGKRFLDYLKKAGFKNTEWIPQTFGISSIYTGKKL
jgi:demethylmenaquinone methyltransferase / 2-methoxy-6-polyprenyl-1,4-benzoquinol methylase